MEFGRDFSAQHRFTCLVYERLMEVEGWPRKEVVARIPNCR
jgi:hypothetical protein